METTVHAKGGLWDRLGIGLSVLCLVHCLALPLVAAGVSVWIAHEPLHFLLAFLLVPLVVLAAVPGYRAHRRRRVLWLLGGGVVAVVGALALEPWIGPVGETLITVPGSALLVAGHWANWKARDHVHADEGRPAP